MRAPGCAANWDGTPSETGPARSPDYPVQPLCDPVSDPAARPTHTPPPPARERDLFLAALDRHSPAARAAFLEEACAGDPSLRQAVDELLTCHRDDHFLEQPALAAPAHTPTPGPPDSTTTTGGFPGLRGPGPGDTLGRYKLLEQIGEGGAGTVFMAEQVEPVRRRVALKLIKAGMDTKSVIARFETERQALALMDHPNIARVFDAGTTGAGRPFFVMELVRGDRITTYCDETHLPTRERLDLFIKVCHAIQHAHQKGIIHRDIKPSNILVTLHDGVPVPKVIDFGISKAIDQHLSEGTFFTEFHAFVGTPAYMSPEQAERSGLDIDTRTDVYSLGVLLYEILTGCTPFDAQELLTAGLDGMRQTIREREPLAPSTRLRGLPEADRTTTASRHRVEPARLVSVLRGDLDWIVLKALEKDRTRRYETANDLARDVDRFLADEPISARPPSAWYRLQKLARRQRLAVAAMAAASIALCLGLVLASWQYFEKSAALRRAQAAEQRERGLRELAQTAQARELELRQLAEAQGLRARERAYAADINLAQHALEAQNLGRARELLDRQRPRNTDPSETPDLRGWEWRYLWQQCRSDALFALSRQSNEVATLTISADGRWLAAGDSAGQLSVTDLRSRREVARLAAGSGRVRTAFSPVAPLLAFSATDPDPRPSPPRFGLGPGRTRPQRIRLWDPVQQSFVQAIPLDGSCLGLAFSRDGSRLAIVGSEGRLSIRQVSDGAELHRMDLPGLGRMQGVVALSGDHTLAAYGVENGQLRLTEVATGRTRWTAKAAEERLTSLAFSPDGKRLASGAGFAESSIRLWDPETGTETERLEGHRAWVTSLTFWPDGATLASTSADQTIRLWNLTGPPPRREAPGALSPATRERATLRGHELEVWSLALGPDLNTLASGSKDGSIYVWDASTPRPRERSHQTLPSNVDAWTFSPDSRSVLTVDSRGTVTRWSGGAFQEGTAEFELGIRVGGALFSPDARYLVAFQPGRGLQLWDLPRRQAVPLPPTASPHEPQWPVGFLPGSSHLVIRRFREETLEEWDLATTSLVQSWRHHLVNGDPALTAMSPDGRWSLTTGRNGRGSLLDRQTAQEVQVVLPHGQVSALAFSADGTRFGSASGQGLCSLWESSPLRLVNLISGFLQGASSIAFSPDSRRVVAGSDGREALKLWDAANPHELVTLEADGSGFGRTAFSPDGNLIGSRNSRGTLHIWQAPDLAEIDRVEAAGAP